MDQKIIQIEAHGTFEQPKKLFIDLENGCRFSFGTGQSGLDGEKVYSFSLNVNDEQIFKSTHDPDHFTKLNKDVVFKKTSVSRTGFSAAVGRTIVDVHLSGQIGVVLDDGSMLINTELSWGLLSATLLLEKEGAEYVTKAKTITRTWSSGLTLFTPPSEYESDKLC
ncbi:MAG: hypothetical protein CMK59_09800 [Proteobacteria bacterium]|nr:hypothetical protein [Pseudomonadota bacterium]